MSDWGGDYGDPGSYDGAGYGTDTDYNDSNLGSPNNTDGSAGETSGNPFGQQNASKDRYEEWKAKHAAAKDYTYNDPDFKSYELEQFKEWRKEEWDTGAEDFLFSKEEQDMFKLMDAKDGMSPERTQRQLDNATRDAPQVKYYQSTDANAPFYVEPGDSRDGRAAGLYTEDYYNPGTWTMVKDFSKINDLLDQIENTKFSTFDEWGNATGNQMNDVTASDEYANMQRLTEELAAGTMSQDALDEAMGYAAKSLGFGSAEEMQAEKAGLWDQRTAGIRGQTGLTDAERTNMQGANRETFRQQDVQASRALEAIRSNGRSTAQYLMMSDEYASQITNQKLKAADAISKEDWDRKAAEWDAVSKNYDSLVQAGMMSQTEYLNLYQQNRAQAMQGYALQVNTMFQENQELFQEYSADMQALGANLQNMYAAMNAEMGFDQWALDFAEQTYSNSVLPLLTQLDQLTSQQALDLQQQQLDAQQSNNMMNFVGGLIGTIGKFFI